MGKLWDSLQNRIAEAVKPHGKLSEFVKATGFSRSAVENWRDGLAVPGVDKLEKICSALNIPPSALLDPGAPALSPVQRALLDILPALDEKKARVLLQNARIMAGLPPEADAENPREKKYPAR